MVTRKRGRFVGRSRVRSFTAPQSLKTDEETRSTTACSSARLTTSPGVAGVVSVLFMPQSIRLRHRAWPGVPDVGRVLGDGAVAGELAGGGDVQNRLARPRVGSSVQLAQPTVGLEVGPQVRQVQVAVAVGHEHVAERLEDSRLVGAEVVGK